PLDRGHLIRRLDPCWGSREEAEQANRDSMYFPNIAPQHKDLNQKVWLDLEDHILGLTDDRNAKVSVFVGCLFDENDPPHKSTGIRVPMGFWKVVASLGSCGRGSRRRASLQAQAFVLRQDHLVRDSDLEIVFGSGFETFQLPVEELERMTGLDFHRLRHADTLRVDDEMREAMVAETVSSERPYAPVSDLVVPIREVEDVVV
ncbi:MAG: DNA/RNA non-specific endonuclease, partial [Rhizobiales bacterium]|nr:DNA/RNA non-specific endonuclease [Hyphomicrobiales bacterium]